MSLETSSQAIEIRTIRVEERLDALRAVELRTELSEAINAGVSRIIVDLATATFVDSAGLAALAKGMKDCRTLGGDLRVVSAVHPDAARVFSLTRFDQVFTMGPSAEALISTW